MQEGFVNINNIPTLVTTFGRYITEKPETNGVEDLIIVIPANNGSSGFYRTFMKTLHAKYQCPVWIIANSGHDIPDGKKLSHKTLGMKEQIIQKAIFFEKYVPENAKVILIGHSFGCYVALELLKESKIENRINKVILLFPLIEKLYLGKKGIAYAKFQKYQPVLLFLVWLFTLLPEIISVSLLKLGGIPEKDIPFVLSSCNPDVMKQVLYVANEEIANIRERDDEIIKKNLHRLRILYDKNDGWLPPNCCDGIKKDFPEIVAQETDIIHAFYLNSSTEVAEIVGKWISENSQRYY